MNWATYIILILTILGLGYEMAKHGQVKKICIHNFWSHLIATAIGMVLYYFAGMFKQVKNMKKENDNKKLSELHPNIQIRMLQITVDKIQEDYKISNDDISGYLQGSINKVNDELKKIREDQEKSHSPSQ